MPTVREIVASLDKLAPPQWAFEFDKVGLQVGRLDSNVERAVVSLDWSAGLLAYAREASAKMVICHHPLLWEPLASLTPHSRAAAFALELAESGIAFFAAHTNWDAAPRGINDTLADVLQLEEVEPFGSAAGVAHHKLVVFAPEPNVDSLLDALSNIGAGVIGNYTRCGFLSPGTGTFLGSESSRPAVGKAGKIERVEEIRLEMLVPSALAEAAKNAILQVHPYEEPAYDLIPLAPDFQMPAGRIGHLQKAMPLSAFQTIINSTLQTASLAWGCPDALIERVAVVGGAADGEWKQAEAAGADVFVTGEVKQDRALNAQAEGLCIISAGHYATEHPGMGTLRQLLADEIPSVEWHLFEPKPGEDGRPAL